MKLLQVTSPYSTIHNLLCKSYLPNIISAALSIGIFDQLSKKEMSCSALADILKIDERITDSLLEVLVTIDFLEKKENNYALTLLSKEYLTSFSEVNQIGNIQEFVNDNGMFSDLEKILKGYVPEFNQDAWSSENAMKAIEQGSKAGALQNVLAFVKELPEFIKAKKMCDIAGNSGYYSYAFLDENPKLHAHVLDLEKVCDIAKNLKANHQNFDRISYHPFDLDVNSDFGSEYDFIFCSHFLYKYDNKKKLIELLKNINRSMQMGGLFVSNHISGNVEGDHRLSLCIMELMTRAMGYPTHHLSLELLKRALLETGFECRYKTSPDDKIAYPSVILGAVKICEID